MPNADSLQARVFGDWWLALDLPRHLVHIPARALIERMEVLSLDVERVSHWRGGQVMFGWLHGLVGMLPGTPTCTTRFAGRRPAVRSRRPGREARRWPWGTLLAPLAALAAAVEIAAGRGGTVYLEARRA